MTLRDIMRKTGVTQTSLADRLGVSKTVVNRHLGKDMRLSMVLKWLDMIGYDVVCVKRDDPDITYRLEA